MRYQIQDLMFANNQPELATMPEKLTYIHHALHNLLNGDENILPIEESLRFLDELLGYDLPTKKKRDAIGWSIALRDTANELNGLKL